MCARVGPSFARMPIGIEARLELGEGGVSEREPVAILPGSIGSIAGGRAETPCVAKLARETLPPASDAKRLLLAERVHGIHRRRSTRRQPTRGERRGQQ